MSHVVGQEEMFVKPATRRVIVQAGRECWWGVDSSTSRVAIACLSERGKHAQLASFAKLPDPARQSVIYAETRALAKALAIAYPPGMVLIEQPSGTFQNLEIVYSVGSIMAGVYDGILDACGTPAQFLVTTSSWWKKRAVGRGDIYKPTKKKLGRTPEPADYLVLRWAWDNGLPREITSWDAADAWGMAHALRVDVALEAR